MNIDWSKAPEWANYHAFDSDRRGVFHEYLPYITEFGWWENVGKRWPSTLQPRRGLLFLWKETLESRPKNV